MTLARASPLKTFSDDSGHRGTFGSAIVKPFEFPKIGDMTSPYTAYRELLTVSDKKGVKHFALWPLDKAALSCFGKNEWPKELPVPQAWLEVDVADIEAATRVLEQAGYRLLVRLQLEPWGQTVTRFLSPEGMLMAVTHTPFLRDEQQPAGADEKA